MARRRTLRITLAGVYYLVVLAFLLTGAVLREINLLVALFSLLAAPLLLGLWQVVSTLRRLEVERQLPAQIAAGQLLVVDLQLRNHKRWRSSWAVTAVDQIQREDGETFGESASRSASVFAPCIKAGGTVRRSYEGRLGQRGRYRFGPLQVGSRFPWGLWYAARRHDSFDTLLVVPRTGRLTARWRNVHQQTAQGSREVRGRQGLVEGDFHGLREWRSGDSQRWIHWRTTARAGAVMVRQFEQQRNEDLAVILDLWEPVAPTPEQRENVELAVSFVATIVADLCRRGGSHLVLAVTGQPLHDATGPASMGLLSDVMEHLALASSDVCDRLPPTLPRVLREVRPGTQVVLVSTRAVDLTDTDRFVELWQDPRLRRWVNRVACFDTSNPELSSYYQVD
ncbi:MAG: DUF58 domain-containing protein [Pirellulales bacterium]|nr:DUF58 domain-containing protein [Pirellulales bacterium]